MEDISDEQFQSFANYHITHYVIDNNQKLKNFYQDENKVIIETDIRKCIFLYGEGLYKLKYVEDNKGLWLVYSDGNIQENTINKGVINTELVIFEKKIDNKIYFTHIDCDYDKITSSIIITTI
jgi:hypothetical protein